jgi:hypothetical protein
MDHFKAWQQVLWQLPQLLIVVEGWMMTQSELFKALINSWPTKKIRSSSSSIA